MKKLFVGCGVVLIVLFMALFGVAYVYGPAAGGAFLGRPIFLGNDSVQRQGKAILDISELKGIYGGTPEFAQARHEAEEAVRDADTIEQAYPALEKAVKAAGGKHSSLRLGGLDHGAAGQEPEPVAPSVTVDDGLAMAVVPAISMEDDGQRYADTLSTGIARALEDGACGVIIDLRGNTGGDMGPMIAGLSPLLPDGQVLEFVGQNMFSPVLVEGNSVRGGGTPTTTGGGKYPETPTAVLVDDKTASSGEATMLSFRGLENSRSFGQPTAGYASANIVIAFPEDMKLVLTTASDRARTGEIFTEQPVEPDVVTDTPEAAARQWLVEKCPATT